MKKGSIMRIKSTLWWAVCLAALYAATATAHHERSAERHYLAFWSGYLLPAAPVPTPENCQESRFWEKGFVSIYSFGAE